ncbi:Phosphoserine phosphatase [Balamuthia mandrillaris]
MEEEEEEEAGRDASTPPPPPPPPLALPRQPPLEEAGQGTTMVGGGGGGGGTRGSAKEEAAPRDTKESKNVAEQTSSSYAPFLEAYGHLNCKVMILQPQDSLAVLLPWVKDPKSTLIALDFDQTVTLKTKHGPQNAVLSLRGGEDTREALEELKRKGAMLAVFTAAFPTKEVVKSISQEMRELGISHLFDVAPLDPEPLFQLIEAWGPNDALSLPQLMRKLMLLLVLLTERYPRDLLRIGHSTTRFEEDALYYKLEQPTTSHLPCLAQEQRDWSAEQELKANHERHLLCPVACWREFAERTKHLRSVNNNNILDRLFLKFAEERPLIKAQQLHDVAAAAMGVDVPAGSNNREDDGSDSGTMVEDLMREEELRDLILDVLKQSKLPKRLHAEILEEKARLEVLHNGVKIAKMGNLFACRYNKPEGLGLFLDQHHRNAPRHTLHHRRKTSTSTSNSFDTCNITPTEIAATNSEATNNSAGEERKLEEEDKEKYDESSDAEEEEWGPIKQIIFVDDNSDNVFNMFMHFANKEREERQREGQDSSLDDSSAPGSSSLKCPAVLSCWYPPPVGGKEESVDQDVKALVKLLAANSASPPSDSTADITTTSN